MGISLSDGPKFIIIRIYIVRRIIYGLSVLLTAALSFPVLSSQVEPYPLEAWAKRADMQNVSISPDGNRLALLKIATDEGNPILEIYDTNDLSARPFKMNADPMEMVGLELGLRRHDRIHS